MTKSREGTQADKATSVATKLSSIANGSESASEESVRQQVKAVLQDLHQHGIGYGDLLMEGIDLVTLRGLYSEVGIQVPSPKFQSPSTSTFPASARQMRPNLSLPEKPPTLARQIKANPGLPEKPPTPEKAAFVLPTPEGSDQVQRAAPPKVVDVRSTSSKHTEKAIDGDQQSPLETLLDKTIASEPNLNEKNDITLPKMTSPNPVTQTKPQQVGSVTEKAVDKVIDRKEYIAKLMAAKGSKGVMPKPVKQALAKTSPMPKLPAAVPATQAVTPGQSDSRPPSTKTYATEAEAKRAAQTELARKKIEALKQSNMSKMGKATEKQTQEPSTPTIQATVSQKDTISSSEKKPTPKPAKVPEPLANSQYATPSQVPIPFTPSTSFFSSLGRSKTMSIPGLLMGNQSSPLNLSSATSSAISMADATPKTLPIRRTSQPESDSGLSLPDQLSSVSTQAQSKQPTPLNQSMSSSEPKLSKSSTVDPVAMVEEPHIATPKINVIEINSNRKRPTASDFIDSPPSRLKRRLGSHQQDDIVLVLSDEGETEDESDRMDVTVTASVVPVNTFSSTDAKSPKPIRDLPPLTDFPSRPKSLVNASVITPPILPIGKSAEQEVVLKAKEEQILAMQRRIAEMEMKRANKRTAGFSSPDSSQVKDVARSTSDPPQPLQAASLPSQLLAESENLPASIEIVQLESRAADFLKLQPLFEPNVDKRHSAVDTQSAQLTVTKRLQHQQNQARVDEIEQILLRTSVEVDSINAKLVVARQEITTSEKELQDLSGKRRSLMDELDLLNQINEDSVMTDYNGSSSDNEMVNGIMRSGSLNGQLGK